MEAMDIIVIILACVASVAIVAALVKKKKSPGPVPRPGSTVTTRTTPVTTKTVTTTKTAATVSKPASTAAKPGTAVPRPQTTAAKAPEPETVTLFSAVPVRNIRRCLSCDGENKPGTKLCCICGRKL